MFLIPVAQTLARPTRREASSIALARAVDQLFDRSAQQFMARAAVAAAAPATPRVPAVDVRESDTHYTVTLDVPGADRERLAVTVEGRMLSVETVAAPAATAPAEGAEAPAAQATADKLLYSERTAPVYARKLSLPSELVADETEARLENGVLTLTLAKKRVDRPRRIDVR